jgi:integrase/recombinase XerD
MTEATVIGRSGAGSARMKAAQPSVPTAVELAAEFLADLANAERPATTRRAYASDLAAFTRYYPGPAAGITPQILRGFFATLQGQAATTRARKQASLSSFLTWAYRHEAITANPMAKLERIRLPDPKPRSMPRLVIEQILATIPRSHRRDRLLYRLIYETGLRIGEALALHVEDLELTPDDEHLGVLGKGGRRRTVLLDDPRLVAELRGYLKHAGYRHGPLFRAAKNGRGGPLRYQSVQERWAGYCQAAGVKVSLHQLRHAHATELVNDGVSLATIRKRLGHKNLQTTARYAEQTDATADAELRERRRRRDSISP